MKSLLFKFFVIVAIAFFTSCAADNCNMVFFGGSTIFNDEIAAVNEAITAFNDDMTTENCEAYRTSVRAFLDKRKEFRECVTDEDLAAYDAEISGLEELLDDLEC